MKITMATQNTQASTYFQLLHAIKDEPLGRRTLVERTGITEMTVRTHLNKLRDAGLVLMAKAGTGLSEAGKASLETLFERVVEVRELNLHDLSLDRFNATALLNRSADALEKSLHLRDAAVRAGASGAILLIRERDGWVFAEDRVQVSKQNPRDAELLSKKMSAREGDVLIITFGPTLRVAQAAIWNVIVQFVPIEIDKITA